MNISDPKVQKRTYESAKARRLYKKYEMLGAERSLKQLSEQIKGTDDEVSPRQLGTYSSKYNWVERARQHDLELIRLEDAEERKEFKSYIKKRKQRLNKYAKVTDAILDRMAVDLGLEPDPSTGLVQVNPRIKSTSFANSMSKLSLAHSEHVKLAHRLYGQAWNIDPLVVNFVQQNNNVQQQNNQLNFLEKLKKNDD